MNALSTLFALFCLACAASAIQLEFVLEDHNDIKIWFSAVEDEHGDEHGDRRRRLSEEAHGEETEISLFPCARTGDWALIEAGDFENEVEMGEVFEINPVNYTVGLHMDLPVTSFDFILTSSLNETCWRVEFDEELLLLLAIVDAEGHHFELKTVRGDPPPVSGRTWGMALLAVFIACLCSLTGVVFLGRHMEQSGHSTAHEAERFSLGNRVTKMAVALSVGTLVGAIFIHFLPEAASLMEIARAQEEEYTAFASAHGGHGHEESGAWKGPVTYIAGIYLAIVVESVAGKFNVRPAMKKFFASSTRALRRRKIDAGDQTVSDDVECACGDPHGQELEAEDVAKEKPEMSEAIVDASVAFDEKKDSGSDSSNPPARVIDPMAYNILIGDSFHNIADGVVIASAFTLCDEAVGWIVLSSVILHELPQELLDYLMLVKAGLTPTEALLANLFSSLTALVGAVITLGIASVNTFAQAYMILFGAGMLTFVSMSELIPLLLKDTENFGRHQLFNLLLIVFGTCLIGLTLLHDQECEA